MRSSKVGFKRRLRSLSSLRRAGACFGSPIEGNAVELLILFALEVKIGKNLFSLPGVKGQIYNAEVVQFTGVVPVDLRHGAAKCTRVVTSRGASRCSRRKSRTLWASSQSCPDFRASRGCPFG